MTDRLSDQSGVLLWGQKQSEQFVAITKESLHQLVSIRSEQTIKVSSKPIAFLFDFFLWPPSVLFSQNFPLQCVQHLQCYLSSFLSVYLPKVSILRSNYILWLKSYFFLSIFVTTPNYVAKEVKEIFLFQCNSITSKVAQRDNFYLGPFLMKHPATPVQAPINNNILLIILYQLIK